MNMAIRQDPFESEETEVPAPGQTITVDWDMDNPAHPAYFDKAGMEHR